jgi:hypothetical protein
MTTLDSREDIRDGGTAGSDLARIDRSRRSSPGELALPARRAWLGCLMLTFVPDVLSGATAWCAVLGRHRDQLGLRYVAGFAGGCVRRVWTAGHGSAGESGRTPGVPGTLRSPRGESIPAHLNPCRHTSRALTDKLSQLGLRRGTHLHQRGTRGGLGH